MNREWMRDVEQQLRELRQRTSKLPTRFRAGSGGDTLTAGSYVPLVTAATPEDLPEPATAYTMGYVTGGTYAGAWFTRIDGVWVGLNVWRAS